MEKRVRLAAILLGGVLWAAPALLPGAQAAGFKSVAADISRKAKESSIRRVVVLEFSAKGAGRHEADYVAEQVGGAIARLGRPELVEREQLGKVLGERRLAASAGYDRAGAEALFAADGAVSGAVYASGDVLKVIIRLIEIKSGKVLLSAEAEAERLPGGGWDSGFGGVSLPDVPLPSYDTAREDDLRDSVADYPAGGCAGRRARLNSRNRTMLGLKARYWALKMRAPGFDARALTRNPGSEIADRELRDKFYKLLSFYGQQSAAQLSYSEAREVEGFIETEKDFIDECGAM